MKISLRRGAVLWLLLFAGLPCFGRIAMEIAIDRANYLRYEPIFVQVRMRNDSGHPIAFGHDQRLQGRLLFEITDEQRKQVMRRTTTEYPLLGTLLRPGETREFIVPLTQYYQLDKPGRYRVHAYVTHNFFKDAFQSNDALFEVADGVQVWERTVGVPDFLKNNIDQTKIRERSYRVVSIFDGPYKLYFLMIEDPDRIYAIRRIGQEVGEEKLRCDVDMLSRIHMLIPLSPKLFRYLISDISGKLEDHRILKTTTTIPMLLRDPKTGRIQVVGGDEAEPGKDYQAPTKLPDGAAPSQAPSASEGKKPEAAPAPKAIPSSPSGKK